MRRRSCSSSTRCARCARARSRPANPWGAGTLEWATSSPPPNSNFLHPPTVAGREPLWDNPPDQPVVVGLRADVRDVLVTHVLDAEPDHRLEFPGPSIWPFLTAIATTVLFIWSIFTPWGVVYGSLPVFVTMVGWFWPKSAGRGRHAAVADPPSHAAAAGRSAGGRRRDMSEPRTLDVGALPPGAFGSRSLMWWGTLGIVLIESTVFALAIASYFFFRTRMPAWPPDGVAPPDLRWGTVNTLILLASVIPNELAKRAGERIDLRGVRIWMVVCLVFGVAFNAVRVFEFRHLNVMWDHDAYGSIVWVLLGLHTTHIVTDFLDTGGARGADVHRSDRGEAVRRRRGERGLLVFRRARVAADLRGDLLGAETAVSGDQRLRRDDVRWLSPLPLWTGILAGPVAWALDLTSATRW